MLGLKHLSISVAGIRTPPVTRVRVSISFCAIQRSTVLTDISSRAAKTRLDRYCMKAQFERRQIYSFLATSSALLRRISLRRFFNLLIRYGSVQNHIDICTHETTFFFTFAFDFFVSWLRDADVTGKLTMFFRCHRKLLYYTIIIQNINFYCKIYL